MTTRAIPELFSRLQQSFHSGSTRPLAWRSQQLHAFKAMLLDNEDAILAALQKDLGKCKTEAWLSELGFLTADIDHTLKYLKRWAKPRKVSTPLIAQPAKSYVQPEPKGVVLIIGAWNYPLQLTLAPLIAAIAAGNCAIVKPSELAEHTDKLIAELLPQYLDKQCFAVVQGGKEPTTELLTLPFDHILYTGGEQVGKIVMRAASEHLTPVTLELGGKSPCIVADDTNLSVTADRIVWSKWMNAGQTCVAPDYILVSQHQADALIEAIKASLQRFYGDDPQQSEEYGRIINQRHFDRLVNYLGGQTLVHGGQHDRETRYIAPTIVTQPDTHSLIMQEEIFGPLLPIIALDDIADACSFINQRPKPLALYVFTGSDSFADKVIAQTSAGSVAVNDGFMFMTNPELPFGGVGCSGMGAYHGQYGFDTFSHLKSVMKRRFILDLPVRYPPFSSWKRGLLKKML